MSKAFWNCVVAVYTYKHEVTIGGWGLEAWPQLWGRFWGHFWAHKYAACLVLQRYYLMLVKTGAPYPVTTHSTVIVETICSWHFMVGQATWLDSALCTYIFKKLILIVTRVSLHTLIKKDHTQSSVTPKNYYFLKTVRWPLHVVLLHCGPVGTCTNS